MGGLADCQTDRDFILEKFTNLSKACNGTLSSEALKELNGDGLAFKNFVARDFSLDTIEESPELIYINTSRCPDLSEKCENQTVIDAVCPSLLEDRNFLYFICGELAFILVFVIFWILVRKLLKCVKVTAAAKAQEKARHSQMVPLDYSGYGFHRTCYSGCPSSRCGTLPRETRCPLDQSRGETSGAYSMACETSGEFDDKGCKSGSTVLTQAASGSENLGPPGGSMVPDPSGGKKKGSSGGTSFGEKLTSFTKGLST